MGGSINIAFRFSDGEACCFDFWTNAMIVLSDIRILDGNEQISRDYIAVNIRDGGPYYGRPQALQASEYGLVILDYKTQTIIDINDYTSLFGNVGDFEIRPNHKSDYFSRKYDLLKSAIDSDRSVIRHQYIGDNLVNTKLAGQTAHEQIIADSKDKHKEDGYVMYDIDTAPWVYHKRMKTPETITEARSMAREIGFPFSRKEGLNANYPAQSRKR